MGTVCHRLDRIANPDSAATPKSGTFESIKRMGEILVFCARGFDTVPVQICPGIVGKQLALQMRSLNTQLWKLYESLDIPTAFTNKMCLAAAKLHWGGRSNDPAWVLGEQDFATWSPSELDKYKVPADWSQGPVKPHSVRLEAWRRNALSQSSVFALLYGNISGSDLPHLQPRRLAIEKLHQLHLSNPKNTLSSLPSKHGADSTSCGLELSKRQ